MPLVIITSLALLIIGLILLSIGFIKNIKGLKIISSLIIIFAIFKTILSLFVIFS